MMKLASKKNPKTFIQKSITTWTHKPYFHNELVFSTGDSFSAIAELNTTKFRKLEFDNNWDFIELPITAKQEKIILEWCFTEQGCHYDFTGVALTQILPLSFQSQSRWFCSEVCMAALQQIGWFLKFKPYHYNPGQLHYLIEEKLKQL